MWDGLFDLAGGAVDLVGSAWYTEQERTEHDLTWGFLDVQDKRLDTELAIAELGARSSMIAGAQSAGGIQTIAIAGVAAVAVVAGAIVLARGA